MAHPKTHLRIHPSLTGRVVELTHGHSVLALELTSVMAADAQGLAHGGYLFSAADYGAMLAVNEANVVLASAQVRFLQPSRVGETLRIEAHVVSENGKKREVSVRILNERGGQVFSGNFSCVVPEKHVLTARA